MKKIALLMSVLLLSGCGLFKTKPVQVVYVDRAVPSCPAPPDVPKCLYLVDSLTPADKSNPGKVGLAYKSDMTCLRTTTLWYQQIVAEYNKTNQDFSAVKASIDNSNLPRAKK